MREIILLIKAGIRRGKGEFSSIIILSFLVGLTLTAILSVNSNTASRDWEAMEEAGFHTLYVGFVDKKMELMGISVDKLADEIKNVDKVEEIKSFQAVQLYMEKMNGVDSTKRMIVTSYEESLLNVTAMDGTKIKKIKDLVLKDGEIMVPFSFQSLFSCEVGDMVRFKNSHKTFRVRGFFEDPFMGGAIMGVKTLLISQNDLEELLEEQKNAAMQKNLSMLESHQAGLPLTIFLIEKNVDCGMTDLKFGQYLNEETGLEDYADFSLSKSQANGYMMILIHIFTGFLAAFVALLLIIVLIVIGHSIGSSLEMEYMNIGILKAIGFTGRKLSASMLLQYSIASITGIICGIPVAVPVIGFVNRMTRPVTGLYPSNKIAVGPCAAVLVGIIIFILIFTRLKLSRITGITPIKAIAGGREPVYFSNRFQMKIHSKGLNIWLAIRQLISNGKQYISAGVITVLLVFFLGQVMDMNHWIGEDGSSLLRLFQYFDADLSILYHDDEAREDTEKLIAGEAKIEDMFRTWMGYVMIQGKKLMCNVMDDPEQFVTVYDGRTCRYNNEILITEFAAKELGISIGDTVEVSAEGNLKEYIVTGYYECAIDIGINFAMNQKGYERLMHEIPNGMYISYQLKEGADTDRILEKLTAEFGEEQMEISDNDVLGDVGIIVSVIHGLTFLIFIIAAIFIMTTVSMLCTKMFAREKKDHGIYKALGFTAISLQKQFAFRFAGVAALGSAGGVILSMLLSETFAKVMFSMMGCRGNMEVSGMKSLLFSSVFIILMYFIVAFFKARRIRKVEPTVLIEE